MKRFPALCIISNTLNSTSLVFYLYKNVLRDNEYLDDKNIIAMKASRSLVAFDIETVTASERYDNQA